LRIFIYLGFIITAFTAAVLLICLCYKRKDVIVKTITGFFTRIKSFSPSHHHHVSEQVCTSAIMDIEDEAAIRDVKEVQRKEIATDLIELHELAVRAHSFASNSSV
jgi:acid phosphatase class B